MYTAQSQISPCNKNCIMDPVTKLCKGCFRTIDEIIQWSHLSNGERNEILKLAESRKDKLRSNELHS